jgi:hypothetical protein
VIGIVREHNLLTGYRFVVVEYAAVSLVLGALAGYYVIVGRWLDAAVWLGIVVNCLAIGALAFRSLRAGATDHGWLPLRDAAFRRKIGADHPHLSRRATALILVTFVPFLLVVLLAAEATIDR